MKTMVHRIISGLALLAACTAAFAEDASLKLECMSPSNDGVESRLIQRLARGVVLRRALHELQVKVAGTTRKFLDEPPYDEPLGGVHYYFCDRKEKFILLQLENAGVFGGTLINEENGQVTPGGQEIIFSADRRAYFASVQPDGLDGQEWKIYAVNGRLSWEGFSFIPRQDDPGYAYAYLGKPRWTPRGEFVAEAQCSEALEKTWAVTLKNIKGRWDWSPKKACPEELYKRSHAK